MNYIIKEGKLIKLRAKRKTKAQKRRDEDFKFLCELIKRDEETKKTKGEV